VTIVPDVLRSVAGRFPERVALVVDGGPSLTFAEWEERSNSVARGFVELGVERGDRVVILVPNEHAVDYFVSFFAAQKAGAIATPVNPRLACREIAHILDSAGPRVLVTAGAELERVREVVGRGANRPLIVAAGEPDDRDLDALARCDRGEFQVPVVPSDLCEILYTSGTTGMPKGVAASHENVLAPSAEPSARPDALLHSLPLAVGFGTYGAMLGGLRLAMTDVYLPRFDTARFAQLIGEQHPGWLMVVPAHVMMLREANTLDGIDLSSVWLVLFGTAPMPPQAVVWLGRRFPRAMLVNGYGLTEAGASACVLPPGEAQRRPNSVGKPIEGCAVRIVDEHAHELPVGSVGEITIRVPTGTRFYYGDEQATAQTWRDGWVYSGDLGYVDDEGFVYVVDRKKDMIVRGGYNVYCTEVEDALDEHPDIVEAAVLGVPHAVLGEDVLAIVRPRAGATVTLEVLHAFLRDRLADYKHPRLLEVVHDPLPRTSTDKLDKQLIRATLDIS
jgi:fatty-acyl-CoA synthase/long-chain acyl-CoA synthetase